MLCSLLNQEPSTKNKALNPIIFALELVSPHLVLVRAIFEGLALGFKVDAPAARNHLAAHLVIFGGAERHVGEVCVFDRLLFDVARVDSQAFGEILPSVLNCTVFANCHNDDSNDPFVFFVPAINDAILNLKTVSRKGAKETKPQIGIYIFFAPLRLGFAALREISSSQVAKEVLQQRGHCNRRGFGAQDAAAERDYMEISCPCGFDLLVRPAAFRTNQGRY